MAIDKLCMMCQEIIWWFCLINHWINNQSIKLCAAADFLMGIYLLIIGAHDVMFRGIYNKVAYDWMRGFTCQAAGALALLSTEVSIIVLALMSVERYLTVSYPFKHWSANPCTARFGLAVAWLSGLQLAVVPLLLEDFSDHFYGSNGVCMPLQVGSHTTFS